MDFFHGLFHSLMEKLTGWWKIGEQRSGQIADDAIKSVFVSVLQRLGYESPDDFERPSGSSPSNDFTFQRDVANDIAGFAFGTRFVVKRGSGNGTPSYYSRRTRISDDKPWVKSGEKPITVEIKTSNFGNGPIDYVYIQRAITKLQKVINKYNGVIFLFPLNDVDVDTSSLLANFSEKCEVPVLVLYRGTEAWKRVVEAMRRTEVGFVEIIEEAIREGVREEYFERTIAA